jgi:putative tricarboxylic transport membrane protein
VTPLDDPARRSPAMPEPEGAHRRELGVAALLVGLAIAIVVAGWQIPPGVQTDPLGPRVFPLALGAAIGLCGVLLAVTTLAPGRFTTAMPVFVESAGDDDSAGSGAFSPGRLVAAIGLTAAYVAAFEPLGYLLATPLYVAALALVHGGASRRALVTAPVLLAVAFYAAFRFGLLIPVPDGILEGWLPW